MSLLLEYVTLATPFPNKQLAVHFRGESNPIACTIDRDTVYLLLTDLEAMNAFKCIQIEQGEDTIRLTNAEQNCIGLTLTKLVAADDSCLSI